MTIALHELPRRRLEATVRLVENGFGRMERLLQEGGQKGIVHAVENTLTEEDRDFVFTQIQKLRGALQDLAEEFALQARSLDIRQVLNAELSSAWVMLENCRPKRMKGYGVEFDPETRAALEDHVEQLLARVLALRAILR